MKKVLVMIPDLRGGGAERVVVNLVNNFKDESIDLTIMTLFNVGVNKKRLNNDVKYKSWLPFRIRGIWRVFKYISPNILHKLIIKETYDVEIAYLEGLCTKIISGGNAKKKIAWLHCELTNNEKYFYYLYKSKEEFNKIYSKYNMIVGVSNDVIQSFKGEIPEKVETKVVHNVLDTNEIDRQSNIKCNLEIDKNNINFVTVGRLTKQKGYSRLLKIFNELEKEFQQIHLYILGDGDQRDELEKYIEQNKMSSVTLLGFIENPYSIEKEMDCFICSSLQEGYSTAISEALYLGIPVITTNCSGCQELCSNGAGIVVDNNEVDLKKAIVKYLQSQSQRENLKIMAKKKHEQISIKASIQEFINCL